MTKTAASLMWALMIVLVGVVIIAIASGIRHGNDLKKIAALEAQNAELQSRTVDVDVITELSVVKELEELAKAVDDLDKTIQKIEEGPVLITEFVPVEKIVEKVVKKPMPITKYKKCTVY